MYLYIKILINRLSLKDIFSIRSGKKIIENKHGSHHNFLENLFIELEKSYHNTDTKYLNYFLFKDINKNLFLSQFFSKDLNTYRFTKVILISLARKKQIILPIPKHWYKIFEKNGLKISKIGCKILFFIQGLFRLLICLKIFLELIIYKLVNINNKKSKLDYMFFNLPLESFPYTKDFSDFSLFSEFINKKIISKNSTSLFFIKNNLTRLKIKKRLEHNNYNFKFSHFNFPLSLSFFKLILLIFIIVLIFTFSFIYLLVNRFEVINFSDEILKYYIVKLSKNNKIPKKYFFNNTTYRYRPLWTYLSKEKNFEVIVYFYSLSELDYKNDKYDYKLPQSLYSLNWENYYTWNSSHTELIKKISKVETTIDQFNSFSLKDSSAIIPKDIDFNNSIAVFDAAPYKKIFSTYFAMFSSDYRCYENILKFLLDINEICLKNNLNIIYKPKKSDSNQISKYFLSKTKNLLSQNNFYILDESISPKKYINKCICTVNFPFTSTAHLNNNAEKSVYYDPTGELYLNDNGSHGIKIINNKKDLDFYIQNMS